MIGKTIRDKEVAFNVCDSCGKKADRYLAEHRLSWIRATVYLKALETDCGVMHGEEFERRTRRFATALDRLKKEEEEEHARIADLRSRIE